MLSAAPVSLAWELSDALLARPLCAYSLGMRQKLGLALGMLGSPRLIVLDKP